MKLLKCLTLGLLLFGYLAAEGESDDFVEERDDSDYTCDRFLMESYDLDGQEDQVKEKNLVCPGVRANCCSYGAQLQIYKKFIVANEGERMKNFYAEFTKAYDQIFEDFVKIEEIAKTIKERTADFPDSNCNKFASTIEFMQVSKMYPKFKVSIRKAYEFLYKSHEGFYCSICDAKAHQYYNLTASTITSSWGFCGKMVEETFNYFNFKFNYFMKFSRLYSEFITKCDLRGKYFKNRFLKYNIKFYRQDSFVGAIQKCEKGFDKPGAMLACSSYCKRFNPVKYNQYLEGEIDKLFSYQKSLKTLMDKMKRRYERDIRREELYYKQEAEANNKAERQLAEVKEVKVTGRLDEEVNEINEFNKQFKTALIRPITYEFKEDLSIKHHINFDESLFAGGVERLYNLVDFRIKVEKNGLHFYNYGEMSMIDKDTAMKIFEQMNPQNAKADKEFEKMIAA